MGKIKFIDYDKNNVPYIAIEFHQYYSDNDSMWFKVYLPVEQIEKLSKGHTIGMSGIMSDTDESDNMVLSLITDPQILFYCRDKGPEAF